MARSQHNNNDGHVVAVTSPPAPGLQVSDEAYWEDKREDMRPEDCEEPTCSRCVNGFNDPDCPDCWED